VASGNEIGPFRAIEESTLAHLSHADVRRDIFVWYSLIGTVGSGFGMIVCGWLVHTLQARDEWNDVQSYQAMFFGYAIIGTIMFVISCNLSKKCEREVEEAALFDPETAPLLAGGHALANGAQSRRNCPKKSILPSISKESRSIFVKLAVLFALDSFGSGLAPLYEPKHPTSDHC
jgi:MFS family permease